MKKKKLNILLTFIIFVTFVMTTGQAYAQDNVSGMIKFQDFISQVGYGDFVYKSPNGFAVGDKGVYLIDFSQYVDVKEVNGTWYISKPEAIIFRPMSKVEFNGEEILDNFDKENEEKIYPTRNGERVDMEEIIRNVLPVIINGELYIYNPTEIDFVNELKLMVATIWGEAAGSNEIAWEAVAHVMANRVATYEWKKHDTITGVITQTQFDAYLRPNQPFREALEYLNKRGTDESKRQEGLEKAIELAVGVYFRQREDFTNFSILYYSPNVQKELHKSNPKMYCRETPYWAEAEQVDYCEIEGIDSGDFKFYYYNKLRGSRPKRVATGFEAGLLSTVIFLAIEHFKMKCVACFIS